MAGRLKKALPDYGAFCTELEIPAPKTNLPIKPLGNGGFSLSFYIRMLFSCLVDADFLGYGSLHVSADRTRRSIAIPNCPNSHNISPVLNR